MAGDVIGCCIDLNEGTISYSRFECYSLHYWLNSSLQAHSFAWLSRMRISAQSSPQYLFQSESQCETFVMLIGSNFNMNED